MAQDAPYAARRRGIELIRDRLGAFGEDQDRPAEYDTAARCRWWLTGEHGTVQAQIMLTAEKPPRVQVLSLAVPPAAGSPLADALTRVIGWLNGGEAVPAGEGFDPALASRRVRSAAAWAGTCRPGVYRGGDGASTITVNLAGEHASMTLTISIDPATGLLCQLDLTA